MPHVIEYAASGRAKCRGCDEKIAKGKLRFGERHANIFGDGEMTLWFHLTCAAYKRPEAFLEALHAEDEPDEGLGRDAVEGAESLQLAAELGIAHRRLPRVNGAGLAPTGRARCRSCREMIAKGEWRIGLVYFEDYRFQPSGFIHAACADDYFGTTELIDRVEHFSPDLSAEQLEELTRAVSPAQP